MRSGLSERAFGALENGESKAPYGGMVRRLASALGLSADERSQLESAACSARVRPRANRHELVVLDPMIGRVASLVARNRLVTLTGLEHLGNPRMAGEMARHLPGAYPGGVCFVDCATLSDVRSVAVAIR